MLPSSAFLAIHMGVFTKLGALKEICLYSMTYTYNLYWYSCLKLQVHGLHGAHFLDGETGSKDKLQGSVKTPRQEVMR